MKLQFWKKKGVIFKKKISTWSITHYMLPTPFKLNPDTVRVFYGTRNKSNQSTIGFSDIKFNKTKNFKIINYSKKKILNLGKKGQFDDNGVLPSSIIKYKNKFYLFYIGWKPGIKTRYSLIAGMAVSKSLDKNFKRLSNPQILFPNKKEPISILTAPFVLKIKKKLFYMWYVSGIKWVNPNYPLYDIKFAKSKDLINWKQTGITCIKLKKDERAVARPFVLKEKNVFKMWYSFEKKSKGYKIGYAESKNGIRWTRKDDCISFSKRLKKIDNQMMEYSAIIQVHKKKFMLYNGNNYGKGGICLAELHQSS